MIVIRRRRLCAFHFIRNLDGLAARGKAAYGNGAFLVSAAAIASLAAAENAANATRVRAGFLPEKIEVGLSSVERAIVARLNSADGAFKSV